MLKVNFNGTEISALGLGTMRLPCCDGDTARPDGAKVCAMVDFAIENGINYFDTAWMYHSGKAEEVCGKALSRHNRDKFLIADKFPGQLREAVADVKKTFETQLQRTGMEFFDFYLLHCVCEYNIDRYLDDEKYGIVSYILKQKAAGRIRHLGFSCHCSVDTLKLFLDRYADLMEFGQLQLNYLDWHLQQAEEKLEIFRQYNLPVWVMEPLRGGALAAPAPEYKGTMAEIRQGVLPHEMAFRFLQSIPEVKVVLSGMSNMEQLCDNIRIFSENKPLVSNEFEQMVSIGDRMTSNMGVPCTACRYCVDKCPQKLDIPFLLSQYNEHKVSRGSWIAEMLVKKLNENKRPSACIGCRSCENICPQQIKISEALKEFAADLAK